MILRILVCEQLPIIRDGIRSVLDAETDFEVIETTDSGMHAMMLIRTVHPDVVLTGLALNALSGLELVRRIELESGYPVPRVVVIASDGADAVIAEALHAGIKRIVTPRATRDELRSAIYAAAQDQAMLAPEFTQRLLDWFCRRRVRPVPLDDDMADLTPREREVMLLVAQGRTTEAIAEELCIGVTTVRTHLHRLRGKLEVRDRSQLVSLAYQAGLVQPA